MSKTFWGLVMFLSLVITAWSGFFVYNELQPKEPVAVPLTPMEPPAPANTTVDPSTAPPLNAADDDSSSDTDVIIDENADIPEETAPETKPEDPKGPQTVTFKLTNANAKKVFVVGDFNKWFRQALRREGNDWKLTLKLKPGVYNYVFVVHDGQEGSPHGRRMRDPNNKQTSKDGKFSALTVKASPN